MKPNQRMPQPGEKLYDPAYYDAGYYGGGARGGFPDYRYGSPEQEQQLGFKWHFCAAVEHASALFIGCALGFEVAYWQARGKLALGYDVSRYAIDHQIPEAHGACYWYEGSKIPRPDDSVDLVASFDVLTHLPDEMLVELINEIVRVARKGIVIRVVVKNWRNLDAQIDGQDGAWFKYRRFEEWDRLLSRSGKFQLDWLKMHHQYEVTAVYRRA